MAAVIIMNALFALVVIGSILGLLGWSIHADRIVAAKLTEHRRRHLAHARQRAAAPRFSPRTAHPHGV